MDTWEYICNQSPSEAFQTVRHFVRTKVLELKGGVGRTRGQAAPCEGALLNVAEVRGFRSV